MKRVSCLIGLVLILFPAVALGRLGSLETGPRLSESDVHLFARDSFRIEAMVCPFKGRIGYEPGEIECGLLQVPENREKRDSRFIELHVVKLAATWKDGDANGDSDLAPGRRDDPIIYLTGGPGAPVTGYVKRLKDHGVRKHRDLYILEQRGIGYSGDFCPFYGDRRPEVGNVPTFEEHLEAGLIAFADCAANAAAQGVDLTGYNIFESARDVKALRIALGFEQWNVWGISYGSILGQAYIKVDPAGIRALALDAIVPLDVRGNPWLRRTAQWYDRDLQKLDELCQAQPDCARHYPDLGKRIREAAQSVWDDPLVVDVEDTERYPTGKAYLFPDVVAYLPFRFLYEQSNYPGLPALIHAWANAVERRDETVIRAVASIRDSFFSASQGMTNAMLCADAQTEVQAVAGREAIEALPILGSALGSEASFRRRAELCLETGMIPRDGAEYEAVETDLPALIIEGEMDPITPPPLAKAILPGFANGTYVEFPYAGHGPSRSVECGGEMLNAFFDDPRAEPDLGCVDEVEAPDFYAPLFTTSLGPRLMIKAREDRKGLGGLGIWAGLSIGIPLIGFLVLTVAPLGRRIDRRSAAPASDARGMTWTASCLVVLSLGIIGGAIGVTYQSFEELLLLGLVTWARLGALAGLFAGAAGLAAVALAVSAHRRERLPVGTLLGFLLTGAAASSFSLLLLYWDLTPF